MPVPSGISRRGPAKFAAEHPRRRGHPGIPLSRRATPGPGDRSARIGTNRVSDHPKVSEMTMRSGCVGGVAATVVAVCGSVASASDPFATAVVGYNAGTNPPAGFTNPSAALGEPTRFTGVGVFPGAVTPFNSPYMPGELVSIGEGGSITLALAQPVLNDPANPFGIDLLIFGNAFYIDTSFPAGVAGPLFGGGGVVEVASTLDSWVMVPGVQAVSQFPTLGYADLTDPYSTAPGNVPTDFTRPVDPAFNPLGLSFAQIVAGYNGSGGGTGIDIGLAGLSSIQYVRISNPVGSGSALQIDGIAAVAPVPGTVGVLGLALLAAGRRTRR
jgi:hypothetical protein